MDGIRQAALCLHGLSKREKRWFLKRLPSFQRKELTEMLQQLKDIGVPGNQDWLPGVEKKVSNEEHDSQYSVDVIPSIAFFDSASVEQIKKILLDQDDALISRVLSIRHWIWEEQLLASFNSKRRKKIISMMTRKKNRMTSRAVESLLSILEQRLEGKIKAVANNGTSNESDKAQFLVS